MMIRSYANLVRGPGFSVSELECFEIACATHNVKKDSPGHSPPSTCKTAEQSFGYSGRGIFRHVLDSRKQHCASASVPGHHEYHGLGSMTVGFTLGVRRVEAAAGWMRAAHPRHCSMRSHSGARGSRPSRNLRGPCALSRACCQC